MGTLYRPKLPKIKLTKLTNYGTKEILSKVDKIIEGRTTQNLKQIHTLIYVGAGTTLKIHNQEVLVNTTAEENS